MQEASLPPDENDRIQALRDYEILDTLPEQAFDDITLIASRICGTPISLVSLVDEDRQWFKSRVGLEATETPRDLAFCAHAILEPNRVLVVEDATRDQRFADNPLVAGDPGIRFYAGAPLVTSDGHAIGTLCVIDRRPRTLTEEQREALLALSRQVVANLELRRSVARLERSRDQLAEMCRLLERQADAIERDLQRAEMIQRSLLPRDLPRFEGLSVRAVYRPGRIIGGDLYDIVAIDDHHVAVVIADAVGHGVSAAMLSVLFKHRLQVVDEATGQPLDPAVALARLNTALCDDAALPGVFVTAVIGVFDTRSRTLRLASAGHPPVVRLAAQGDVSYLGSTGPALGLQRDATFGEHEITLTAGDRLLLYTDGLLDSVVDGPLTVETVAERLRATPPGDHAVERFLIGLTGGQERAERDDVTVLMIDVNDGESTCREVTEVADFMRVPEQRSPRITRADVDGTTVLCFEGRVTWLHAEALQDAAVSVMVEGRPLVLDLGACEHLDSTMLGTLHELVVRAEARGAELRLQRVPPAILATINELCMTAVRRHIADTVIPVPDERTPIELPETDLHRQRQRLLRAHELLADLSDANRQQFEGVVETLRREKDSHR